jgi:hypothetical protein
LVIGIRARHYHFLGNFNALSLNIDYKNNEDGENIISASLNYDMPLNFWGRDWTLSMSGGGTYYQHPQSFDYDDPLFNISAGLGTWWQFSNRISLYTSLTQSANGQLTAINHKKPGSDPYFLQTSLGFSLPIRILNKVEWLNYAGYTLGWGGSVSYRIDKPIAADKTGFYPYINNNFSVGNIKRIDNFKQGFSFSTSVNTSFNPYKAKTFGITGDKRTGRTKQWAFGVGIDATATGFYKISNQLGVSGRIAYNYSIFRDDTDADLGGVVRGIRDDRVQGDMYFYWNVDLINNLFIWRFSRLGEVHGHIFYDGMMVRNFRAGWQKPFQAIGLEAIIYPSFARNMQLRLSLGQDIEALLYNMNILGSSPRGGSAYELYVGIELHY